MVSGRDTLINQCHSRNPLSPVWLTEKLITYDSKANIEVSDPIEQLNFDTRSRLLALGYRD